MRVAKAKSNPCSAKARVLRQPARIILNRACGFFSKRTPRPPSKVFDAAIKENPRDAQGYLVWDRPICAWAISPGH